MVQIGKTNTLTIKNIRGYTIHLDGGTSGDILLDKKRASGQCQPGNTIDVFVYVDREQQLQATSQRPLAIVGEFAKLRVKETTVSGAYLDWGLDHDLLVPKSEQQNPMREGKSYYVYVFLSEKTNRITGSSKLDQFLGLRPPNYRVGQEVDLVIYDKTDIGYGAMINSAHAGMLYNNEVFQQLLVGQELKGFIKKIRNDLKIDLSLRSFQQTGDITQIILKAIQEQGGCMNVTDKSSPEEIFAQFGVSKKIFKRAIGSLYKKRLIVFDKDGISLADTEG